MPCWDIHVQNRQKCSIYQTFLPILTNTFCNLTPERGAEVQELPSHVLDILNLSEQEKQEMKNRIAAHDGVIRVYVHPYFADYYDPKENGYKEIREGAKFQRDNPRIELIKNSMGRILRKPPERTPPTFIFEEQHQETEGAKRLHELNK